MRQKRSQIQKNVRKQMKEEYFRRQRTDLLLYREKQALQIVPKQEARSCEMGRYGWRGIALQKHHLMEQQTYEQKSQKTKSDIDFQINVHSLEDGQYYLNTILEQVNIRCFEATIYLLGKLISKILRPIRQMNFLEEKIQINLVYMILTHTHNLLQANISPELMIKKYIKNKKYLQNLFAEDYKLLLNKQDAIIINQLISISQNICSTYSIPPNYQLIKYLLLRVTTKENLQSHSENDEFIKAKLENLLMNFIILHKVEERSTRKELNIPHEQIIYDFNSFIQFNLMNIYDFIRNNDHPFEYLATNDDLCYMLSLQSQMIKKFRVVALNDLIQFSEADYLICESIVALLEKIVVSHEEKAAFCNDLDETAIVLQETVTIILWYLIDVKLQVSRRFGTRTCLELERETCEAIDEKKSSIVGMILLIKVRLRELSLMAI